MTEKRLVTLVISILASIGIFYILYRPKRHSKFNPNLGGVKCPKLKCPPPTPCPVPKACPIPKSCAPCPTSEQICPTPPACPSPPPCPPCPQSSFSGSQTTSSGTSSIEFGSTGRSLEF